MTAVDLEALDKLRGALRAAHGIGRDDVEGLPFKYPLTLMPDALADALLPVVERIANERAAAELRAAAFWFAGYPLNSALRARADALDGRP